MADHRAAKTGEPKSREKMIIWTRDEWLLLANELQRVLPACYLPSADEMVGITSPMVARAQLVLAADRQRPHIAIMAFKTQLAPKLLSAFRDLTNRQLTAATEAARVEAEPVPPAAKPAPIVHAPPVTIPGTSAAPKEAGHNIRWTKDEWLAIAIKLHHQYPLLNLLDSEHLACLTSGDVAFAQRVLDPSRQRPNLKIVSFKTILKSHLLAAFKELKARLADPAFEPAAVLTAVPVAAPAAQPAPVSPVEPVAVAPAAPFTPPAVVAPADMNPYEAALRPLLDLMMHQLAAGPLLDLMVSKLATTLQPMLARTIETAGAAVLAAAPPVAPAPSPFGAIFKTDKPRAASTIDKDPPPLNTSPSGPSLKNYAERAPAASSARQGKPSIGLVGGGENGNDYKELTKTFPGIEFHYVSREKYMKSVKNCDKVIGMNKFSSHNLIDKAKRTVGDRFVPTDGGLSEMKRMISIWIASGILPGMPATRLDEAA
jgi:hypothetical protein